jgi:hypothetical protein
LRFDVSGKQAADAERPHDDASPASQVDPAPAPRAAV